MFQYTTEDKIFQATLGENILIKPVPLLEHVNYYQH